MTFQRPTIFSLSTGVTLLGYTLTFGSSGKMLLCSICSASFLGLGGVTRASIKLATVWMLVSLPSERM